MSDISVSRSKTPPSPHHFDSPLNTIVPGVIPNEIKKKKIMKEGNLEAVGIKNRLKKGTSLQMAKETTEGMPERKSRPNTAKSEQRIRWDSDHVGVRNTHWNEISPNAIQRKANDQTIQISAEKPLLARRKGEWLHTPLGKIKMDLGSLFMGELEVGARFFFLTTASEA
jgi:hypothetical protein